jgi:hypothetical protein
MSKQLLMEVLPLPISIIGKNCAVNARMDYRKLLQKM